MTPARSRERPFAQEIWDRIDATARGAADEVRAGRRLLEVVGPIGFGARAGVAEDLPLGEEPEGAHVHVPTVRPLPVIHRTFALGARAVEAEAARRAAHALRGGGVGPADRARRTGSRSRGSARAGVRGLLGHDGAVELPAATGATRHARRTICSARSPGSTRRDATAPMRSRSPWTLLPAPPPVPRDGAHALPAAPAGVRRRHREGARARRRRRGRDAHRVRPRVLVGGDLAAAYDGREGVFHRISLVESVTLMPGVAGSVAILRGRT